MAISATQIRRGMIILFNGELCKVMEFRHHTPGNLRAMVQAKLRNIKTVSSLNTGSAPLIRLNVPCSSSVDPTAGRYIERAK